MIYRTTGMIRSMCNFSCSFTLLPLNFYTPITLGFWTFFPGHSFYFRTKFHFEAIKNPSDYEAEVDFPLKKRKGRKIPDFLFVSAAKGKKALFLLPSRENSSIQEFVCKLP